jgi:hypothetical protein
MIPAHSKVTPLVRGINHAGYSWDADLEQTQLFPIRMQTVCLGIDCYAVGGFYLLNQP